MARRLTDEERRVLTANPELVMFMPRRAGMHPTMFLLVIPITTMVVTAGVVYRAGLIDVLVERAPVLSCLAYVMLCAVIAPWSCLHLKWWYDGAYGNDRELRRRLAEDVTVERVHITGFEPQRAEVYAEGDNGPFMFGIASTIHTFVPEEGTDVAILHAPDASMAVRPDPRTRSLLDW